MAATISQLIQGMKTGLAFVAARATVCFQMFGYLDVASWRRFLPHDHSWVNATIVFVLGQPGKQDQGFPEKEIKTFTNILCWVTMKTTG